MINDAKHYFNSFEKLLYSHVTGDCNNVAHSLTRHLIYILEFLVWIEEVLPQFFHVLQADLVFILMNLQIPPKKKVVRTEVVIIA